MPTAKQNRDMRGWHPADVKIYQSLDPETAMVFMDEINSAMYASGEKKPPKEPDNVFQEYGKKKWSELVKALTGNDDG
jgi:hypothetical protein